MEQRLFCDVSTRTSSLYAKKSFLTFRYIFCYLYRFRLPEPIQIPLHTLIKITPMAYGCHEERYALPIDAVDTHRPKPVRDRRPSVTGGDVNTGTGVMQSRAPVSRDYFGDNMAVSDHGVVAKAKADAVSEQLERDATEGLLTPKAVRS